MRALWPVLIFFVLLGFGVSLAVPVEDAPDTAYDESELLPYEGVPLFSIVVPQTPGRIAEAERSCDSLLRFNSLAKRCKRCRENNPRSHRVSDSLPILNHSLRC